MAPTTAIVQAFNALSTPTTTPNGHPNHWVVGIRHSKHGELVFPTNPASSHTMTSKDSSEILDLPTAAERAQALLPLLLGSFVTMHMSFIRGVTTHQSGLCMAPWTWSCDDATFVEPLNRELQKLDITRDLFDVGTASRDEKGDPV